MKATIPPFPMGAVIASIVAFIIVMLMYTLIWRVADASLVGAVVIGLMVSGVVYGFGWMMVEDTHYRNEQQLLARTYNIQFQSPSDPDNIPHYHRTTPTASYVFLPGESEPITCLISLDEDYNYAVYCENRKLEPILN